MLIYIAALSKVENSRWCEMVKLHMDASSKIEVMEHVFPLGRKIIRRKIYPLVQSCFFVMVL